MGLHSRHVISSTIEPPAGSSVTAPAGGARARNAGPLERGRVSFQNQSRVMSEELTGTTSRFEKRFRAPKALRDLLRGEAVVRSDPIGNSLLEYRLVPAA